MHDSSIKVAINNNTPATKIQSIKLNKKERKKLNFYGIGAEPMEISQSPMSSPDDTPCGYVKLLKGHTSEVWTHLFFIFRIGFLLPLWFIESYFIRGRFLLVHGIHQLHFLHLGEYRPLRKEIFSQKYLLPVNSFYFKLR